MTPHLTVQAAKSGVSGMAENECQMREDAREGIVRANSFTLPKGQNRISRPLIFLHFSRLI